MADEILGGVLGVVQAVLIVACVITIFDSFFRLPVAIGANQVQVFKDIFDLMNASQVAIPFRETIIPLLVAVTGPLLPADIQALFPRI